MFVRRAFSMLEILIVIFIIALGASIVVPRLMKRKPESDWPAVIDQLNNMLYFARQESVTRNSIYRLVFNQKKRGIQVEVESLDEETRKKTYAQARSYYFTAQYDLPDEITLEKVMSGKKELLGDNKGVAYCYVVPSGLAEQVAVTLKRTEAGQDEIKVLDVEPFLGVFSEREVQ